MIQTNNSVKSSFCNLDYFQPFSFCSDVALLIDPSQIAAGKFQRPVHFLYDCFKT